MWKGEGIARGDRGGTRGLDCFDPTSTRRDRAPSAGRAGEDRGGSRSGARPVPGSCSGRPAAPVVAPCGRRRSNRRGEGAGATRMRAPCHAAPSARRMSPGLPHRVFERGVPDASVPCRKDHRAARGSEQTRSLRRSRPLYSRTHRRAHRDLGRTGRAGTEWHRRDRKARAQPRLAPGLGACGQSTSGHWRSDDLGSGSRDRRVRAMVSRSDVWGMSGPRRDELVAPGIPGRGGFREVTGC